MTLPLATVGYQSSTLAEVIRKLKEAGVERLIDVRAIAASRRPGFSKSMLAASLAESGISYVHLRALGTPKPGREAARAGRVAEMRTIYEGHLEEPEAQAQLAQAISLALERPSALLCFEADARGCHRSIIAEHIRAASGCEVVDL